MKQRILGVAVLLSLMSLTGCLSGADLADPGAGSAVAGDSAAGALTDLLGGSADEISKGDLLAMMIELFAASSESSDSEALLWEVAASAARDGRAGVKRSVADFVVGQIVTAAAGAATPATP